MKGSGRMSRWKYLPLFFIIIFLLILAVIPPCCQDSSSCDTKIRTITEYICVKDDNDLKRRTPGWVNGTISSIRGDVPGGTVVRITDFNDISKEPIVDIEINPEHPRYSYQLNASRTYHIFASAPAYRTTKVYAVNITNGNTTWLNFTLVPFEMLSGWVYHNKKPLVDAVVEISQPNGTEILLTTSPQGRFKTIISSGSYNITIWKPGYVQHIESVVVGQGETVEINITLEKLEGEKKREESDDFELMLIIVLVLVILLSLIYILYRTRDKEAEEPETDEWECPGCGAVVDADMDECKQCGRTFKFRCPRCGAELDQSAEVCEECGNTELRS